MSNDINVGAISEALNNKVDLNQMNTNAQGLAYVGGLGFPSGRTERLSILASYSTYTAPANGYFLYWANASSNGGWFHLNSKSDGVAFTSPYATSGGGMGGFVPVRKGEVIELAYGNVKDAGLVFKYTQGEQ